MIKLSKNNGFKWKQIENISVKGYLFQDKNQLDSNDLLKIFSNITSFEDFITQLKTLNGSFALILELEDKLFFAVDIVRSFPLFYSSHYNTITDAPEKIELISENINPQQLASLLLTGCTSVNETLNNKIHQLQAGQCACFDKQTKHIQLNTYYAHDKTNPTISQFSQRVEEKLQTISKNVFERLIMSLDNRPAVLPLSGGYDSRYILAYLKDLNYKNIITYSYGKKDSYEVKIAEKVAQTLNVPWFFIEYNKNAWSTYFTHNAYTYVNEAHALSSLPHLQDYPALYQLHTKKLIPQNSIIIPGYCGDGLGGTYLPSESFMAQNELNTKTLVNYIYDARFKLFHDKNKFKNFEKALKEMITSDSNTPENENTFISALELWIIRNQTSKFIINSVRFFEHFGYEWRMPLWDIELVNFWNSVSINCKRDGVYDRFLLDGIFKKLDIAIAKSIHQKSKKHGLVGILRSVLKNSRTVQRLYAGRKDANAFDQLIDQFTSITNSNFVENKWDNRQVDHFNVIWFLEKFILKNRTLNDYFKA